jgi:serine protease
VAAVKDSNGNVTTPGSAAQDECICTTSTCGAGMLDAGSAVATAQALLTATAPVAVISPTSPSVVIGSTVTLSGTGSTLSSTGAALGYQWSIADSSSAITLSATTGSSVVVTGVAAGSGQVQLTVTDANGMTATSTTTVTVTAPSSSGGGAANPAWLLALVAAGLLLGPRARRTRP